MASESIEDIFRQELFKRYKECQKYLIPKRVYYIMIEGLKSAYTNTHTKIRSSYYQSSKYEILQCGDVEKLIMRRTHPEESPLYFVSIEDTFDVIKRAHIATGHGGCDRMIKELQRKYANIPTKVLEHFKSLCVECQKKRNRPMTKGVVLRPILTKEFEMISEGVDFQ